MRRRVFYAILGLFSLPLLYLLAAIVGGVMIAGAPSGPTGDDRHEIRLIAGPIHYDFLLPLDESTRQHFGWLAGAGIDLGNPAAEWLIVGWGAREFYTTTGTYRDVSLYAVWAGLTGDRSVMHIGLAGALSDDIPATSLTLTSDQYRALLLQIDAGFAHGSATKPLPVPGFSQFDRFFPALGRFHAFNTCNVWIGRVLRASGVRFGMWTPLPLSVTLSLKRVGL